MKKDASNSSAALAEPDPVALATAPLARLEQIAARLQAPLPPFGRPGFSGGQLGPFLFLFAYAALIEGAEEAAAAAQRQLQAAIQDFLGLAPGLTYYRELAEFGSVLLYLQEQGYLDESVEPLLEQVDRRAVHGLEALAAQQQFDPFVGYLPLAHYFLWRHAAAASAGSTAMLRLAVDTLLRDYQPGADGTTGFWFSGLFGQRQIYLSWSHGQAAMMLFLTQLLAADLPYRRPELRQVLAGAARYCLLPHAHTGRNRYPDIVDQPGASNTLNLCYGDLGIGFALLQAARALADADLDRHAHHTLALAAARRDPAACNVHDASLIYGASGNAMLFKALQQDFPEQPGFGEAAAYWYEQAQALCQHPGQVAGFRGHYNQQVPSAHYSLFEGLAGVGLALLEFEVDSLHLLPLLGYPAFS